MEKIKLADGTMVNISNIDFVNGILKISTPDSTVEELAEMFSNKSNTNLITIMARNGKVCGYKSGFTSFAGITYDADGTKTIELFQPMDTTEARISNAESMANQVNNGLTDVELAITELYELMLGGIE